MVAIWAIYTHCRDLKNDSKQPSICCSVRTFLSFGMFGEQFEEMRIRRLVLIACLPFSVSLWEMTNFLCSRLSIPKMGMTLTVAFVPKIIRKNKMIYVKMPFKK